MFGRITPQSAARAEYWRDFFANRSRYATTAGVLGVAAPLDGLIFLPLTIAAIVVATIGWCHLRRQPHLRGHGLCIVGWVGGAIGLALFAFLHFWDGLGTQRDTPAPDRIEAHVTITPLDGIA